MSKAIKGKLKKVLCLATASICLGSCVNNGTTIYHEDTIVNKETRQEIDNVLTWLWDVPMTKTSYYLILEKYGDMKVDEKDYNKYKIGDIYTWEEIVYE